MRYPAPWPDRRRVNTLNGLAKRIVKAVIAYRQLVFSRVIKRVLKTHDVAVLIAVRQDLLKWALSKYHGDGTGNPGHLQFKLANGAIGRDDISRIHVDCHVLGEIIDQCEKIHAAKRRLQTRLRRSGLEVYPVLYEEFLRDRATTVEQILQFLGVKVPRDRIDSIISQKEQFVKVHSDDIRDFVENYDEVIEKFGNRFAAWS
jgi:LPS sulfotransferase NodH